MYDIIWKSKAWFILSAVLVLISLLSMVYNKINTGNFLSFWIDFSGGAMMEMHFEDEVQKAQLHDAIDKFDGELDPVIQNIWENAFIVRTKKLSDKNQDERHVELTNYLKQNLWSFEEPQFTTVWPTVWEAMKKNAFIALAVALVAIIIFIAISFSNLPEELSSWNFWFAAILALAHDVFITIWAFSIMWILSGIEIDTLFITALLTVMWFSVHDTIVVFDRIRENIFKKGTWDTFTIIWNKAVNQTLSRSINTSISTLLPLVAMYMFGSDSISMFVLALIVWISIWTYSSIFLATPFLVAISSKEKLWDLDK